MGALTEVEIFDCLITNFRLAAEHSEDLARLPRKGPTYVAFRKELKLIEGAARQASVWRQDTRWLQIGLYAAEVHKRAGDWLRGVKGPNGFRMPLPDGQRHPLFMKLAENLRMGQRSAEALQVKRTNRVGMILPVARPGPHRDTRPVHISRGGILLPGAA